MLKIRKGKPKGGRVRVGPDGKKDLHDAIWPYRHGQWWNWDAAEQRTETVEDLMARMRLDDKDTASESLAFATAVAKTAIDRAEAADRRATTIASSVAIAASFTLGGAGLVLDKVKWGSATTLRNCFAVGLCLTTLLFVLAAIYALRALVSKEARRWNWLSPRDMWKSAAEPTYERRLGMQGARILNDFAGNWELADLKNRNIDNALRSLVSALLGLTVLAVIAALAVF
jgi:hypothetical protein